MRRSLFTALAFLALTGATPVLADGSPARLGHDVVPTAELLRLNVDPIQPTFNGSVRIDLKVNAPADSFQLNARDLGVSDVSMAGPTGPIPVTWNLAAAERITVHPNAPLKPGTATLDIDFRAKFDTKAVGLYRLRNGTDWYAYTQFESDDARQAFPCWDEPEFKIPWRVVLNVPPRTPAIANTPIESFEEKTTGMEFTFKQSPPMPSYLVAFAVGPFEVVNIPGMSMPGQIVTPRGQSKLVSEGVKMTPPIVAALEKYFKRPYPYEKLDLISVPEYNFGAMENPGAITFLDRWLSLDPATTTDDQRRLLATTIAHEVAHMWFGDLVTMKWWDDLWLNESFAEWMGYKITDQVYPEYHMPLEELDGIRTAYRQDGHLSTRAMRQPVGENLNLEQLADALAYKKGQSVLGMVEAWVGPEAFRTGVIDYLTAHAWGNAEASDLWSAVSKASGQDLASILSSYLDQPGVPVVTAELVPGKKVRLTQQRYLAYGETAPTAQLWKIPVQFRFSDGKKTYTQKVLLTQASQTVDLKPAVNVAWIHPNANERGYYHWNMSPELMASLSKAAPMQLTPRERMGFVYNLDALLEGGQIHGDDYLQSLSAFGSDTTAEVVNAVLDGLTGVKFAFVTSELREPYARYLRRSLSAELARLGDPKPGDGPSLQTLRARLAGTLGVDGRDPALIARGQQWTKQYLADPTSVDPTLIDCALRLAAATNDTALYYECRRRFESATLPTDRKRFLTALGYFKDPALADQTLQYMLVGPLKPQELLQAFGGYDTPELHDKLWQWAQKNYDVLSARIPPFFRVYLVYFAGGCSRERLESAKVFFSKPEHAPEGTAQEFAKLQSQVLTCVSLREREGERVARMLNDQTATK